MKGVKFTQRENKAISNIYTSFNQELSRNSNDNLNKPNNDELIHLHLIKLQTLIYIGNDRQ